MPGLMHVVSLQQAAGVEAQFTEFVEQASRLYPAWRHSLLNRERSVHPFFRDTLAAHLQRTVYAKYRWGLKLPSRPQWLRTWHCRRELADAGADIALIWNRTARVGLVLDAMGEDRCIHWEHGAIWDPGRERERQRYLARVPLAITNSQAAARVLRLLWDYRGTIRVCRNALRPSLYPAEPQARRYPTGRAIRLGVAARLFPVKGIPSVLHAVKLLRKQSIDVELQVAGAGPERPVLERIVRKLGVVDGVRFLGAVDEMSSFYSRIDCLLHPPLTEAFGLVTLEAAAHGCPVIATRVDGLAEAVEQGVTGSCVSPTLSLDDYRTLGGSLDGIPAQVYDPAEDRLTGPMALDPARLAAEVVGLLDEPAAYEHLSRSASEHVRRHYRFDTHVDAVMSVIETFRTEMEHA